MLIVLGIVVIAEVIHRFIAGTAPHRTAPHGLVISPLRT